jgi:hypothetical protein
MRDFNKSVSLGKFELGMSYHKSDDNYFAFGPSLWLGRTYLGVSLNLMSLTLSASFYKVQVWKWCEWLFRRRIIKKHIARLDGKCTTRELFFDLGNWSISGYSRNVFRRGFKHCWLRVGPLCYFESIEIEDRKFVVEADKFDDFIESWNEPSSSD